MKESELYLQFIKRNLIFILGPVVLAVLIGVFNYAQVPTQTRISQEYKLTYSLENIDTVLALTEQAVSELRAQRFNEVFPDSLISIYKSAPLNIVIEATTLSRENSYALLLKEAEYLRQNFSSQEVNNPLITQVEPNLFKYLISGLIIGGLVGLIISLTREYLRNY